MADEGEIMAMRPRSGDPIPRHVQRPRRLCATIVAFASAAAMSAAAPAQAATFETIFNFTVNTGASPQSALAIDSHGNLVGVTGRVLFEITGPSRNFRILHRFSPPEGSPFGRPLIDEVHGIIYGTTFFGGRTFKGTIWSFDPVNDYLIVHSFTGGPEGAFPVAGLSSDAEGMLYGTTTRGGTGAGCDVDGRGCGTVFKFDPGTRTLTTLHSFQDGSGILPLGEATPVGIRLYTTVPQDNFTLNRDEIGPGGPVRMRKNSGGDYMVIPIFGPGHWFFGGVTPDSAGNVWGLARETLPAEEFGGGIYKIDPSDHYELVFAFPGIGILGTQPLGKLAYDAGKNVFYGVTFEGTAHLGGCGTVFRFNPTILELKTLHVFNCNTEGSHPRHTVTLAPDGSLYGTTSEGGADGYGTIYHITP
jgi:uncharacterized repeat protein (TIGR03803 family)